MTFWLHYNPFQKKKIASRSHMEQGILSGKLSRGCPWDKWHGADAAAMWLQGKWARSYSPVAGAPSLCSAALLSALGRDALLLWGHKEHTGSSPLKAPLPLSTVCIFLREKGQKLCPVRVFHEAACRFSPCISFRIKYRLNWISHLYLGERQYPVGGRNKENCNLTQGSSYEDWEALKLFGGTICPSHS